jgi:hypothetical protein
VSESRFRTATSLKKTTSDNDGVKPTRNQHETVQKKPRSWKSHPNAQPGPDACFRLSHSIFFGTPKSPSHSSCFDMSLSLHGDGLNDDSLRHVVGYLDGVDLSRLECVCLEAKEIAESYGWDIVARQDVKSPCQLESSSSLSLKNRVVRWTLTSRYAAKIESRHEEQLKRDEAIPGPTLSQGVKASRRQSLGRRH